MVWRFTDYARSAVYAGFRRRTAAPERDVARALAGPPRGVASRLLDRAGIVAEDLPTGTALIEKRALLARAVEAARQRGANYVGTEHVLLALAGLPESALPGCGASAERLGALLTTAEAERRQAHPPIARRLGVWFRSAVRWLRGRT